MFFSFLGRSGNDLAESRYFLAETAHITPVTKLFWPKPVAFLAETMLRWPKVNLRI
jgi:hypothetical protein